MMAGEKIPCSRITPACAGRRDRRGAYARDDWGSPPRARGEDSTVDLMCEHMGITPACAGRSASRTATSSPGRDHPRVRGEKALCGGAWAACWGSPPRARGEARRKHELGQHDRITPACAGRRTSSPAPPRGIPDHPRVCGEKLVPGRSENREMDHPRVCGEKGHSQKCEKGAEGSPPRVRGEVSLRATRLLYTRITPACAGRRSP